MHNSLISVTMKKILSKSIFVINALSITFLIASFTLTAPTQEFSLLDAIKNKTIVASVTSNGKHSGFSVNLNITNSTKSTVQLVIPAGTKYNPQDNGEQTLIQLKDEFITLKPNGTYRGQVAAFCTEASDRCPTESTKMNITQNTDPKFDRLFTYLKGKNITKSSYQDAVWAISDGYSVSNIVAENAADKAFRKEVATITGQKNTWFTSPQSVRIDDDGNFNMETLKISGHLSFDCPKGTKVLQDIHKENGDVFYASDRAMTAQASHVNYAFHLAVMGWEKGTYYIRIHDGTNELGKYEFTV